MKGWLIVSLLFKKRGFLYWQVIRLLRLAQIGSMDLVRRTHCFVWPVSMGSWRKRPSALRTKPLMSTATLCFTPMSSPAQVNGCWKWKMKQSLSDTDSYWEWLYYCELSVPDSIDPILFPPCVCCNCCRSEAECWGYHPCWGDVLWATEGKFWIC